MEQKTMEELQIRIEQMGITEEDIQKAMEEYDLTSEEAIMATVQGW